MPRYKTFRRGLEHYFLTSKASTNPYINDALRALRVEKKKEKVAAKYKMGDDINASTTGEENMTNKPDQPQVLVDKALEILVHNAMEEVGFAPRDVYRCVFVLGAAKHEHAVAKDFDYLDLQRIVQAFFGEGRLISDHMVAVSPRQFNPTRVQWEIGFKSNRIARKVVASMQSTEDVHLRKTYDLLQRCPGRSGLAGRVFEPFVHRVLSTGWESDQSPPQLVRMTSNDANPPTFSAGRSRSRLLHPPTPPPVRTSDRFITHVDLDLDLHLSNVTFSGENYYVPVMSNNPPFNSFTIDHDPDNHTVLLSIFQVAPFQKHGGLTEDYFYVQRLVTRIRKLLGFMGRYAAINTTYFVVCHEGESKVQWTMPLGWEIPSMKDSSAEKDKHSGDVFCLRLPGTSCLFDPNLRPSWNMVGHRFQRHRRPQELD